jgi:hypothetical protein
MVHQTSKNPDVITIARDERFVVDQLVAIIVTFISPMDQS